MSLITITETGSFTGQPNATLSFDHGAPQPITITDPFSDTEEARLRWYFEEHLCFPFTDGVRAILAEASVRLAEAVTYTNVGTVEFLAEDAAQIGATVAPAAQSRCGH